MLIRRLRYWMESAKRSEALREGKELHLAEKAAELQADGMTPAGARAEARRRFGNVGLKHEESGKIWIKRFWSELGQDVRYGCRTMTANKAFSALAVLSLALGSWRRRNSSESILRRRRTSTFRCTRICSWTVPARLVCILTETSTG